MKTSKPWWWLLAVCLAGHGAAQAQPFPSKPIRVVVPFSAGGAPDMMARLIGQALSANIGQPVVIENRDGAAGRIGSEAVARSAPDGYTLLLGTTSTHTSVVYLTKNLSYDPIKDFTPVINAAEAVHVLVVSPSLPVKSAQELIDYARRNPGKLVYGTQGVGSYHHLTGELVKAGEKVDILHVPFKGIAPAVAALISGQINMMYAPVGPVAPHARAGKLRVLALIHQFDPLPNVPQLSDELKTFQPLPGWLGYLGPAGMPQPVVARLNSELARAIKAPEVAPKLAEAGLVTVAGTAAQFALDMKASLDAYGAIVKAAGLKPE